MRFFLATLFLLLTYDLAAQIRLPAEVIVGYGPETTGPIEFIDETLQGKIKHITEWYVDVGIDSQKNIIDSLFPLSGYGLRFDEHGNMIASTSIDDGKEEDFELYFYDNKNRLYKTFRLDRAVTKDSIVYDDVRNIITRHRSIQGLLDPILVIYHFDKVGNLVKMVKKYPVKYPIFYEDIFDYDNKNRLIREICQHYEGIRPEKQKPGQDTLLYEVINHTSTYEYIDKKKIGIVRKFEHIDGKKWIREENIEDKNAGTKVYKKYSGPQGYIGGHISIRTDSLVTTDIGRTLYSLTDNGNAIFSVTQFDKSNRRLKFFYPGKSYGEEICQYKFDKIGNWIEVRRFVNGKLFTLKRRTIEYFE